jgi:hypothetical protein
VRTSVRERTLNNGDRSPVREQCLGADKSSPRRFSETSGKERLFTQQIRDVMPWFALVCVLAYNLRVAVSQYGTH